MRAPHVLVAPLLCAALATPAAAARVTLVTPVAAAAVDTAPPAPIDTLALVDSVLLCPRSGCNGGPLCANDSLVVWLEGQVPNPCWSVKRVDVFWPPVIAVRPFAPWVRVIFDDGSCLRRLCPNEPRPWIARVVLPPLPDGPYSLHVAPIVTSCTDSIPGWPYASKHWDFETVPCDTVHTQCFFPWFDHPTGNGDCDASIGAGASADIVFGVHSEVPVGGVQGEFVVSTTPVRIAAIQALESGWGLRWTATEHGARFVMVRTGSVPTPANGDQPLVRVRLVAPTDVTLPPRTYVFPRDVLASDPVGHAIPQCRTLAMIRPAVICTAPDCDANEDGRIDVRDLVREVRCLRDSTACMRPFDCTGDGDFTLDDVLCCANQILRIRPCTTCPPDSAPPKNRVSVAVGVPQSAGGEVRVPVAIVAADAVVGAARLAFALPSGHWQVAGVDCDDPAWLTLADLVSGEAVIGAIRISDLVTAETPQRLTLTLRLVPFGDAAGGELGAVSVDLSAADGAKLAATIDGPVRPLPGGPTVSLSANRPEPFSGTTRFTLSLPAAATVDLGVFDLHGRRIATLVRGTVAAGITEYAWDGRDDRGARVGAGVYFYRANTDARTVTRRMVYLGSR